MSFIYSENNSKADFHKLANVRSFPIQGSNWSNQHFPAFSKICGWASSFSSVATPTRRPSLTHLYPGFSLKTGFFSVSFGACLIQSRCPNAPLLSDHILLKESLHPSSGRALKVAHPMPSCYRWEGGNWERERASPDNLARVGRYPDSSPTHTVFSTPHCFPSAAYLQKMKLIFSREKKPHTQKRTTRTVRSQGLNAKSRSSSPITESSHVPALRTPII